MNATKMDWATGTEINYSTTVGIYWLQVSGRNDKERWFFIHELACRSLTSLCTSHCSRPHRADKIWDCAIVANHKEPPPHPPTPPPTLRPPTATRKDWGGWSAGRYSGKWQDSQKHSRSFSHFWAQKPAEEQQQVHDEYFCIWAWSRQTKYAFQTINVLKEDQLFI